MNKISDLFLPERQKQDDLNQVASKATLIGNTTFDRYDIVNKKPFSILILLYF